MSAKAQKPMKKIPMRKCVGCNEHKPKIELTRVLRTPEGEVVIDRTSKRSGRGAYICQSTACLAKAIKSRRLQIALSTEIPDALFASLEHEIAMCADAAAKGALDKE